MKTRLNLYTSEYRPTVSLISLNSLVFVLVMFILLSVSISTLLSWQASTKRTERDSLRQQLSGLQQRVDESQRALSSRKPDPSLLATIELKKLTLQKRESVLGELSAREDIKTNQFSQVMSDLDKADIASVWLTKVIFNNGNVALEGFGNEADAMPLWLNHLSNTQSFSGIDFQHLNIQKQEQGLFFSLRTNATTDSRPGEQ